MLNLTKKDLKVSILHALFYFLCVGLGTAVSILLFHSPNMFYAPAMTALLAGWVYFHLLEKVPKFGSVTLIGLFISLFFLLSRHYILAVFPNALFALLADLLAWSKQYQSPRLNKLSYLVFSLGNTAPLLAMWLSRQGYIDYLLNKGKDMAYVNRVMLDFTAGNAASLFGSVIIAALLGGLIGNTLLRHFKK
ncbi:Trep_Strep domain-containing protein [Streptococcus chenjunshii]|uniref:Trep_Strep domain-containing protein n=1 Tax=Streptococcus chenjunshii TaxID=2173853 RepID=A0A372KNY5_9STRE|nr:MptD family putative ECF transporter S component [Streptococcus chenjunshii]AXQ78745.1 Trep_Strep domain-containing protein [Streptococcus chenjunshii]RFU51662.1 Trep_Strep domain-containing protein [Streptococcus chenjunshii]RFU53983.1 Trep_Strep domain-containing protein [Streptococcus chenjunshii]